MSMNPNRTENVPNIPHIDNETLSARAKQFKFIHKDKDGNFRVVIRNANDTKAMRTMFCLWNTSMGEIVSYQGETRQFKFYSEGGYSGFQPSLGDVLSQIPAEELVADGFDAFYIDSAVEPMDRWGYFKATTVFVRLKT